MRERESELEALDVRVLVVSFEAPHVVAGYVEDTGWPWPVLVDEERRLYRALGFDAAGLWDVWGPRTWLAYARALARGQRLVRSDADTSQRGGDVLVDPSGVIRLHHVGEGPADRPEVGALLDAIRGATPG